MALPDLLALDIQGFAYFLFNGTLHPDLVEVRYLPPLLQNPADLERVFALLAHDLRTHGRPRGLAAQYLLARYARSDEAQAAARRRLRSPAGAGPLFRAQHLSRPHPKPALPAGAGRLRHRCRTRLRPVDQRGRVGRRR
jgi:hypothetical protein